MPLDRNTLLLTKKSIPCIQSGMEYFLVMSFSGSITLEMRSPATMRTIGYSQAVLFPSAASTGSSSAVFFSCKRRRLRLRPALTGEWRVEGGPNQWRPGHRVTSKLSQNLNLEKHERGESEWASSSGYSEGGASGMAAGRRRCHQPTATGSFSGFHLDGCQEK